MTAIETISVSMLDSYYKNPDFIIIDLRSAKEYEKSHFKEAENIPYEILENCCPCPREKTFILYCERGSTSLFAARQLMRRGYHVKSVIGGIRAYCGENLYFNDNHSKIG